MNQPPTATTSNQTQRPPSSLTTQTVIPHHVVLNSGGTNHHHNNNTTAAVLTNNIVMSNTTPSSSSSANTPSSSSSAPSSSVVGSSGVGIVGGMISSSPSLVVSNNTTATTTVTNNSNMMINGGQPNNHTIQQQQAQSMYNTGAVGGTTQPHHHNTTIYNTNAIYQLLQQQQQQLTDYPNNNNNNLSSLIQNIQFNLNHQALNSLNNNNYNNYNSTFDFYPNYSPNHLNTPSPVNSTSPNLGNYGSPNGLTPDQLTQLMNTVTLVQTPQHSNLSSSPPSSNSSSTQMLPPQSINSLLQDKSNATNNYNDNPILLLSGNNLMQQNVDQTTHSYSQQHLQPNVFSSFFSSSASMSAYPPTAVSKATLNGKINQQRAGFPVCYNVQTAKVTLKLFLNQNPTNSIFQMTQNRMYQCNEIEKLIPKLNLNEIAIFGFVVFCENSSKKREVLTHLETFYSQSVNPQDYSAQIAIGTYGRKCSADLVKHCGFIIAYRMNKESFLKQSGNSFFGVTADETAQFDKAFVQEVRFGFRKKAGREKLPLIREPVICDVSKPIEYHDFLNNHSILKLDDLLHSHYQPITRFCTSVQDAADAVVTQPLDVMKDIKNVVNNFTPSSSAMDETSDVVSEKTNQKSPSQPIQTPKIEEEDGFDLLKFNESVVKNLAKSSIERWLNYEPIVNEHPSYLAVLLGLIYSRGYFSIVESKSNIPINIDTLEALMNLAFDGTPVTVGTLVGNVQINLKEVFLTNDINYILYYLEVKELVPCFMAGVYLYCLLYYTKNDMEKHRMEPYVSNMRKNFTAVTQDFYFEDYKVLDIGDSLLTDNSPEFMTLAFKKLKNYVIKIGKYYNKLLVEQAIVQNNPQTYEFNKQERLESSIDGFSNYLLNRGSIHEKKRTRDDLGISSSFTENDFIVKPRRTFALQKYEDQKMAVIEQDKKVMLMKSFVDSNTSYENNDVLQVLCELEERRLELEKEFAEKLRLLAEKEKYSLQ
ncbi:predicted protein [Naegleria gruberi]|uniref:Predicted protein n=1 Tax=Naegleria gruberi TaxID=5762 RepID=D2VGS0_NAEGR|nr:uncharacterized protein NAEGRDRAFT_79911 [Naegleria gruberi]EFC44110.1 predicted protein [Naegleria gruberi]|eukprot:XP_002676854.1 predicted protein [Naegleria gruberi strain NEG-M]